MKRFLTHLLLFACVIVVVDLSCGCLLRWMRERAVGGNTAQHEYIANRMTDSLLVFGSSRAAHHYDPVILADSLHVSAYNCGCDGMGIILFYARYRELIRRYRPRYIVYDALSSFDLSQNDNTKYLTWSRPYYSCGGVDSVFWAVDETERFKMLSQMYRYNSKVITLVADCFIPDDEDSRLGYHPITGMMNYTPPRDTVSQAEGYVYDALKLYYWKRLLESCRADGVRLILVVSPFLGGTERQSDVYEPLFAMCGEYQVPVLNHLADTSFISHPHLFRDRFHLNKTGATQFSALVAAELKPLMRCQETVADSSR